MTSLRILGIFRRKTWRTEGFASITWEASLRSKYDICWEFSYLKLKGGFTYFSSELSMLRNPSVLKGVVSLPRQIFFY